MHEKNKWRRITNAERGEIEILAKRGYSLKEIAKTFKRVKSAIWYELQKKRNGKRYDADYAKHLSYVRMRAKRKEGKKIALDGDLREFVEAGLMDDQSPEAIEGRIKHIETKLERTSAFSIRRFIKSPYGRRIEAHRLKVFKKKLLLRGGLLLQKTFVIP